MSDAVRNYTGSGGRVRGRAWQPKRRVVRVLAVLIVVLLIVMWWLTRDNHDITAFMPKDTRYSVVLVDPIKGRDRISTSNVWNAWPDPVTRDALLTRLRHDSGLPQWIENNLITQRLVLMGDDVRAFSDILVLTHMSRIGVLLERLHGFSDDIVEDIAGGLHLRRVESDGLFYAVRGRILLASPNRTALIRALTLSEDDSFDEATSEELLRLGAEDVRGTVQLAADDPLGDAFESIAFAIRIDNDQAYAKCHAIIRDTARQRFGPLLNGAKPYELDVPFPGPIEISANFGKPVREVWASLGEALQSSWLNAAQWQNWEGGTADGVPGNAQLITTFLGPMGPGIRLTCLGIDANEIIPVPQLVGTLDSPNNSARKLDAIPPAPADAKPWDSYPRYDAEKKLVRIPLVGGPSMEPAAAVYGKQLLIATSRAAAEATLKAPAAAGKLAEQGNLFVRLHPTPLVDNVANALAQFADADLLKGYTSESFETAQQSWRASAARVNEVVVLASGTAEAIDCELRVLCAPQAVPAN